MMKETPFGLVYGGDAVLPIEVEMISMRVEDFSEATSEEGRLYQLDTIEELREKARIRESVQKWRIEAKYLSKVHAKEFKERDLVLRKAGEANINNKLALQWIGPYRIREVLGRGAYKLEALDGGEVPRTWNVANLRFYYS